MYETKSSALVALLMESTKLPRGRGGLLSTGQKMREASSRSSASFSGDIPEPKLVAHEGSFLW